MKIFKITSIMSSVIFFLISIICFISATSYDIDAYDFANIYNALNPAKVFLIFAVVIFIFLIVLCKRKNINLNIEKMFLGLVVVIYACFGVAYLSSTDSNNSVLFERVTTSEIGHEFNEKYLPYYDEYSDLPYEKGEYEIYKGESNGTVMIYVDADIANSQGYMYYEAEYLNTRNILLYYKYLTSKMSDGGYNSALNGAKNTYNIDGLELELYQNKNDYAAFVKNKGEIFYVTLSNVIEIAPEDFVKQCAEQYYLMQETIEQGSLLVV